MSILKHNKIIWHLKPPKNSGPRVLTIKAFGDEMDFLKLRLNSLKTGPHSSEKTKNHE